MMIHPPPPPIFESEFIQPLSGRADKRCDICFRMKHRKIHKYVWVHIGFLQGQVHRTAFLSLHVNWYFKLNVLHPTAERFCFVCSE